MKATWKQGDQLPDADVNGTQLGKAGYVFPEGHPHAPRLTPHPSAGFSCSDDGNALRLVARHGANIRYVPQWKGDGWLVWVDSHWKRDSLGHVMELAKDTARAIVDEASAEQDDARKQVLSKWAATSLNGQRRREMVEAAKTDPRIALEVACLDRHIWLLPCLNGTLDLRLGAEELFRPARREDLMTMCAGVEYDADARLSKTSRKFLQWVSTDRPDLEAFLQRALGYTLTGNVALRLLFLLLGPDGHNGKSTLLTQVRAVMGDFAKRTAMATFEKQRFHNRGGATEDVARLKGARFVTAIESDEGMELSAATIKELVGNEEVIARALYRGSEEYMPHYKFWLATNHEPVLSADDQALWDRLRLVPFDNRVAEGGADVHLGDKLAEDGPAWLTWMVEGCLAWQRDGIGVPLEVKEATTGYRNRQDYLPDFFEWLDESGETDFAIKALHGHYETWAHETGHPTHQRLAFKKMLLARGWTDGKDKERKRIMVPPKVKIGIIDYGELARSAKKSAGSKGQNV